ncbi:hypothetical protein V492_00813 [Pseudogymnoascus sp. VKM F-4246]|nr:hypothetical protein V492_00813 [Pseudogymnoascus sp. VKM F-4246]
MSIFKKNTLPHPALAMYSLWPLTFLAAFSASVDALNNSYFLVPPGGGPFGDYDANPTYEVGTNLNIKWQSDLETIDLVLQQDYPKTRKTYVLISGTKSKSLNWEVNFDNVSTGDGNGNDAVFYLTLFEAGHHDKIITTCHYFNVTVPEVVSTTSAPTVDPTSTSSLPSSSSPSSSLPSSSSPSSSSPSSSSPSLSLSLSSPSSSSSSSSSPPPPTLEPEPNPNPGPSTGAVAGIAVGATLAGLLVLGGLGFLAWRHCHKKKSSGQNMPGHQAPPQYTLGYQAPPPVEEYSKPPVAGREWNQFSPPPQTHAQGPRGFYEAPGHPMSRSLGPIGPYETYEAPGHPVSRSQGPNGIYEAA